MSGLQAVSRTFCSICLSSGWPTAIPLHGALLTAACHIRATRHDKWAILASSPRGMLSRAGGEDKDGGNAIVSNVYVTI